MKRPIKWHEKCLANYKDYLLEELRALELLKTRVFNLQEQTRFYEYQITEAKRLNKDGFDPDKWRRKIPQEGKP